MTKKRESEVTEDAEHLVLEGLAERLASDVENRKTGRYAMWEVPFEDDTAFKRVEALTADEIAYLTERLHWFAMAALNQIALVTETKFPAVLEHFNKVVGSLKK